jgi:hypothetical protein
MLAFIIKKEKLFPGNDWMPMKRAFFYAFPINYLLSAVYSKLVSKMLFLLTVINCNVFSECPLY